MKTKQQVVAWSGLLVAVGCGLYTPKPTAPFHEASVSGGPGWFCFTEGQEKGGRCKRSADECAREQSHTAETSACMPWNKPVHCFTYRFDQSDRYNSYCFMDREICNWVQVRARTPHTSGDGESDSVSECRELS